MQSEKAYKDLINQTFDAFNFAITDNDMPETMRNALQDDARLFGGLKTNAQLFEASKLLLDDKGNLKPFNQLSHEYDKLNIAYNKNYLEAEYEFAVGSSQMASKWSEFLDNDRYELQYRTAGDNRVREEHASLNGVTLPKSDPFWSSYTPPNGWNCRCTVVEVLKDKFPTSDSDKAIKSGEAATYQVGKDGKNRLEIFRFNPGAQKVVFPPAHPYNKVAGAKTVEKQFKKESAVNLTNYIKGEFPTNKEIKNILKKYAELSPEDFRNGLDDVKFLKSKSYMMQHSMQYNPANGNWVGGSKISLSSHEFSSIKFNPLEEFRGGLSAIKKGEKMTFNQEYSFESMWHEILHAKTKTAPIRLSQIGTKNMEVVNQFCARHTYPDFIKKFGGEAIHQNDILDKGYGYQGWINDFRTKLKSFEIDEKKAVKDLMPSLMEDYSSIGRKINEFFITNTK
ncbi:phage minor head protein [Flavobacterium sp. LB3P45]|uniref:Phage minor head protein n=1 Tax=Flavobacterium fructosi TaxID=3230416 RepID=A0ABW6HRI5_9FLAO